MERIKQAEEKKKAEEKEWAQALRQQMDELKLREEEVRFFSFQKIKHFFEGFVG